MCIRAPASYDTMPAEKTCMSIHERISQFIGVEKSHFNPIFLSTDLGTNLGLPWKTPTTKLGCGCGGFMLSQRGMIEGQRRSENTLSLPSCQHHWQVESVSIYTDCMARKFPYLSQISE